MNKRRLKKLAVFLLIYLILAFVTYLTSESPKSPEIQEPNNLYRVTEVVDGDTIKVDINGNIETIRLLAIDTPETRDPRTEVQCFGREASNKMKELTLNKYVLLERDTQQGDRDSFDRLLRYVYLKDGTSINAEMVKQGYAFAYREIPSDKLDEYIIYEQSARNGNLGLWGSCEY